MLTEASPRCAGCKRILTKDEVAVTRKLVNRGAVSFFCISCLARHFEVTETDIRERIRYYKENGCTLFE